MGRDNYLRRNEWTTVGVTALPPGWRNVHRVDGELVTYPCPAVLLQENRRDNEYWDAVDAGGQVYRASRTKELDPPYDTQAVFAEVEYSMLVAADETGSYLGTVGPDEDPRTVDTTNSGATGAGDTNRKESSS